jgi:hypothetical protein
VARGSGFAYSVTRKQWQVFGQGLTEATAALDKSKALRSTTPIWYANALRIAQALQMPRAQYDALFAEAIKVFPDYDDLHFLKAYYLTPILVH